MTNSMTFQITKFSYICKNYCPLPIWLLCLPCCPLMYVNLLISARHQIGCFGIDLLCIHLDSKLKINAGTYNDKTNTKRELVKPEDNFHSSERD